MSTTKKDLNCEILLKHIKKSVPAVNLRRVERAYQFAKKAHEGQFRRSGEPYVVHPMETAKILAGLKVDEDTILAGLLHDVPEDTEYTVEDIESRFGKHVAQLVNALTKLSKVHYRHSMGERQIQSLRKMVMESAKDMRVVIIKLADRLHNMTTLHYLRPDKQQRIAKETLEIYAPLANLYGIFQVRRKLEDLCFKVLQPEEYHRIEAFIQDHEKDRQSFVKDTMRVLKKDFKKQGLNVEMEGRPKHLYSIYQKTVRSQKKLGDIFDYFAIRIITESREDCYRALATLHDTFKPKPGRFKDYIALPKLNGYQSLHTTLIGLHGKPTEIQVRTRSMHYEAEYGAAAHILYKDSPLSKLQKDLFELKDIRYSNRFIETLQDDLLQSRIYVFALDGEVVNLPEGATCLDFVYAVDLPVDKKRFKASVNNKPYALTGELQSGDYVEIVFGRKDLKGPERWWLDHVKTTKARRQIQSFFHKKSFQAKRKIGFKLLQQKFDYESRGLVYQLSSYRIQRATAHFRVKDFDELLALLGEGTLHSNEVYHVLFPKLEIGWVNVVKHLIYKLKRRFNLVDDGYKYRIGIAIESYDRVGLLRDIFQPFYDLQVPILKIKSAGFDVEDSSSKVRTKAYIEAGIEKHEELTALFDHVEKVPGVITVRRDFRKRQIFFVTLCVLTAVYFVGHPFAMQQLIDWGVVPPSAVTLVLYVGLASLFALMAWLRSMGNKTFPHFEETKYFWPLSFAVSLLAMVMIYIDGMVFKDDLNIHLPVVIGISCLIFLFVFSSYLSDRRRKKRFLQELEAYQTPSKLE